MRGLRPTARALTILATALAFVAAGCGRAIPPGNGGHATVRLQSSPLGKFLVDAGGHTLYLFDADEHGESYCDGACASVWPPYETDAKPQAMDGLAAGALGTIKRDDGDMQVTYHGHPLYFYAADASVPGRTKGEDIKQFGASWYLLGADGKSIEPKESEGSGGSGKSGGGGGY